MALLLSAEPARADDPLNSSEKPASGDDASRSHAHNELNIVPAGGGTTDIGIGGGYFAGLTRVSPGSDPYVWNLESAGFVTFERSSGGGVIVPYQDVYFDLTIPRFFGHPMRLELRPEYSWETTLSYYGIGNASTVGTAPPGAPAKYFMYGRLHPYFPVDLRWRLLDHVAGHTGLAFEQSWYQVDSNSKLAADMSAGSSEVKRLIGSLSPQGVATLSWGLQWDNRDNEVSSHRGMYHSVDVKLSPGGSGELPYRYAQGTAVTRFFVPIWKQHVVLAARLVGDVLYGDPPFYELARFNDGYATYAIGGLNGVRGVPAQRFYGKVKVFGNAELRTEIASFHALGHPIVFGVTGFLDGGRVWADTSAQPQLDGRNVGLKYGAGGGIRFQSGSAFVLRGDVAYSPDASPIGAYVAAGQMF
jgi:outer membrane protein assembly factor BamA